MTVTAFCWGAYLYLIRDAVAEASVLVILVATLEPYSPPEELRAVASTFGAYALIAILNAGVLITWARYNQLRFRGRDRRKPPMPVTLQELSESYGIPPLEIFEWQQARVLTMHHDEAGELRAIEVGTLPELATEAA
jgi:biofilm PGA synthesis protein PgaD